MSSAPPAEPAPCEATAKLSVKNARAVADLLADGALLGRLRESCRTAREPCSVEAMAESFAGGVMQGLRAPRE